MDAAVRYLARRARTESEVRRHLAGRGYPPPEIDASLRRLAELGYIDDHAFAVRYAAWAAAERPMGRRRIARDLRRRGVSVGTIERALEAEFGAEAETAALESALAGVVGRQVGAADDAARRRIAAFLLRRGFPPDEVMSAVERWGASCERTIEPSGDFDSEGEA